MENKLHWPNTSRKWKEQRPESENFCPQAKWWSGQINSTKRFGDFVATNETTFEVYAPERSLFWEASMERKNNGHEDALRVFEAFIREGRDRRIRYI